MSPRYYLISGIIVVVLTMAISWWEQKKSAKEIFFVFCRVVVRRDQGRRSHDIPVERGGVAVGPDGGMPTRKGCGPPCQTGGGATALDPNQHDVAFFARRQLDGFPV